MLVPGCHYTKFEINPNMKSRPTKISIAMIKISKIQMANFKRYHPMIAARTITRKNMIIDTSINAKNMRLHSLFHIFSSYCLIKVIEFP